MAVILYLTVALIFITIFLNKHLCLKIFPGRKYRGKQLPIFKYPNAKDANFRATKKAVSDGTLPGIYQNDKVVFNHVLISDFDLLKKAFSEPEFSHRWKKK